MKKEITTAVQTASKNVSSPDTGCKLNFGYGPAKMGYEGQDPQGDTGKFLRPIGIFIAIIGGGWVSYILYRNKKHSDHKIAETNAQSANKIAEGHEASLDKMNEQDNQTDNRIREAKALSDIRMQERAQMQQQIQSRKLIDSPKQSLSLREWIEGFHKQFPMPDYSAIPFLAAVLDGCPDGFKDAMLMSLLSECGALCFSKVRALYSDGILHSPSLQVVIEGEHGSGKGKFLQLHNCLFERIIKTDITKLSLSDDSCSIIQTAGINISQAKFYDVMAGNHGVHIYAIESEINTVENVFKKSNGLSFDYLRKAFHNETIYQNNKAKGAVCGLYPVFFNYTFTGTPKSIDSLIDAKEVEGGTASRICFAVIPEVGCIAPSMSLPCGDELESMRDQIDAWRKLYCYNTIDGKDVACPDTKVNIDYICDALDTWQNEQYNLFLNDGINERKQNRLRMATIAFHCAIVLHMLAGEPKPNDRKLRKTVKELTIYIANYCMERYLCKFSEGYVPQGQTETEAATTSGDSVKSVPVRRRLTDEEIMEWYPKHGSFDDEGRKIGLGYIARVLNVDKDCVRNSFKRYEKEMIKS